MKLQLILILIFFFLPEKLKAQYSEYSLIYEVPLEAPVTIDVHTDGSVYCFNQSTYTIRVFDPQGKVLRTIYLEKSIDDVQFMRFNQETNRFYLKDYTYIRTFSETGAVMDSVAVTYPYAGIEVDDNGDVFFCIQKTDHLEVLRYDGNLNLKATLEFPRADIPMYDRVYSFLLDSKNSQFYIGEYSQIYLSSRIFDFDGVETGSAKAMTSMTPPNYNLKINRLGSIDDEGNLYAPSAVWAIQKINLTELIESYTIGPDVLYSCVFDSVRYSSNPIVRLGGKCLYRVRYQGGNPVLQKLAFTENKKPQKAGQNYTVQVEDVIHLPEHSAEGLPLKYCRSSGDVNFLDSNTVTFPNVGEVILFVIQEGNSQYASLSTYDTIVIKSLTKVENFSSIYPNPTTDFIRIVANDPVQSVKIFSPEGKDMGAEAHYNAETQTINIESFPFGLYFLHIVSNNNQRSVLRFVKSYRGESESY
jgi:hypothetical protein